MPLAGMVDMLRKIQKSPQALITGAAGPAEGYFQIESDPPEKEANCRMILEKPLPAALATFLPMQGPGKRELACDLYPSREVCCG